MTIENVDKAGSPARPRRVGFVGIGLMGAGMVEALARAGHSLRIYNRTRVRAEAAARPGVVVVDTPAQAADGAEVVFLMLADPAAVRATLEGATGLLTALAKGTTLIDSSTVDPTTSRWTASRVQERGGRFLDAPVFGSKREAADGELGFIVGGAPEDFAPVQDLFVGCLARTVRHMGPVGAGTTTKLVLNAVMAMVLEASEEGLVLARKAGIDPKTMMEILMDSRAKSGILEMKARQLLGGDFAAFFPLRLMHKDLDLALSLANSLAAPVPALAATKQTYSAAMAGGMAELDFSAAIRALETAAGTAVSGS